MKPTIFTVCLLVISITAFAQYNKDFKGFGDKAFGSKNYYEAAYYYKQAADGLHMTTKLSVPFQGGADKVKDNSSPDQIELSYKLAESYRLYENYIQAEPWYYKVVNSNSQSYPFATLWYGVCLRANQRFDEALVQLKQFLSIHTSDDEFSARAKKEIATCEFAKEQYQYPRLIDVSQMEGDWNGDGSNYAVINKDSVYYFTSSRIAADDKKHLNRIYKVTGSMSAKPQMIEIKDDDKRKETEYGTPAITPDGTRLYFTKWYKDGVKTIHVICFSDWKGGKWSNCKKMNSNVNAEGFNAIQPFITADGKQMFFASNKPGGQGGDDIWVSDLGADGNAVNSVNLGSTVNSTSDEEAPSYNQNEKVLTYSSKGFTGLGGFDFFTSTGGMGLWTKPRNMGYPMNSAKDDLYLLQDKDDPKKFYISSDRESDCCLDLFQVVDKRFILSGTVNDCDTQKPLEGVKISFVDSLANETMKELTTGSSGKYTFAVNTKRPYNLKLEKKGYFTKVLPVPMTGNIRGDTLYSPDLCLQAFVKNKPIKIENILYDFDKATLRDTSKIVLNKLVKIMKDNPRIIVELASHTDSIGTEEYNQKLSQARAQSCVDYIIASGVSDKRIYAKGYGKTKPVAPNSLPNGKDNPDGRQLNRRTEFTVIKTEE